MSNQQTTLVDDRHAILNIAVKPRDTIRYLLKTKNIAYFIFVGIVGMFASNLMSFEGTKFNGNNTLGDYVYSAFMSSLLLYFLSTFLSAAILMLSTKVFGGKGTFKDMFCMISVTMIPYIWILPIILFWMQYAPQSFFEISYMETGLSDLLLEFVCGTFILIASIWTFVLTIIGISEVHQISKWRAFFSTLIVILILVVLGAFFLI